MDLKGKTAVIIGATGGIGRVLSIALALEGVKLILVGRRKEVLSALKDKIRQKEGEAQTISLDATKTGDLNKLSSWLSRKHKSIDILIHAAGIGVYKPFEKVKLSEWKRSFEVNVTAVFLISQKLMPLLKKSENAYVISLGSGMGKIGISQRSPYCASKFALRGLMLSLAKEYEDTNIKFILLTMGSILTSFGPLTLEEKLEKQQKGKRYLKPSQLAHLVVNKLKNNTLKEEVTIYPRNYYRESK